MAEEIFQVRLRKRKDLYLKFLALFFAFLLWFFVVLQDKIQKEVKLRLVFRNLPKNMVLLRVKPTEFELKVIGPRSILRSLSDKPVILPLDLSRYTAGTHTITLSAEEVKLPSGLKVLEIDPPEVEIVLDLVVKKWLKVKPDLRGSPPENCHLKKVRVEPVSVKVRGARKILRRLKVLYTHPIYLSDRCESFQLEVPLSIPEGVVEVFPDRVKVRVEIQKEGP